MAASVQYFIPHLVFSGNTRGLSLKNRSFSLKPGKTVIGRAKDCNIVFLDNHLISSRHCEITLDEVTGIVTLVDKSTNGIVLNGVRRLIKDEKVSLNNGDVVYLVKKKSTTIDDVSFTYTKIKSTVGNVNETSLCDDRTRSIDDTYYESGDTVALNEETVDCIFEENACATAQTGPIEKMPRLTPFYDDIRLNESNTVEAGKRTSENSENPSATGQREKIVVKAAADESGRREAVQGTSLMQEHLEQTLLCSICQEIMHDCVSLTPCNHKFCGGCYSDWMTRANDCPICRRSVDSVTKDYQFNSVIQVYLDANPEKKRSIEELNALDLKNKITADVVEREKSRNVSVVSAFDEDSEDADSFSVDFVVTDVGGVIFGSSCGRGLNGQSPFVCQSCPGYSMQNRDDMSNRNRSDFGLTSIGERYQCVANQNHSLCQCCLKPLPNRSILGQDMHNMPATKCEVCNRCFCFQYWKTGCLNQSCRQCLKTFSNHDFVLTDIGKLLLGNQFESKILIDYMADNGVSAKQLFDTCIQNVINGVYRYKYIQNAEAMLCRDCALQEFGELAYQYRCNDMANNQLPDAISRRKNCWWGRNCRTQCKNPDHARRLNHICDQTRH